VFLGFNLIYTSGNRNKLLFTAPEIVVITYRL
jgi:hypothetical protein